MMPTGRPVSCDEALAMGLINRIANNDAPLLDQARQFLTSITGHSKLAINAIRECAASRPASSAIMGWRWKKTMLSGYLGVMMRRKE